MFNLSSITSSYQRVNENMRFLWEKPIPYERRNTICPARIYILVNNSNMYPKKPWKFYRKSIIIETNFDDVAG